MPLGSPTGLDTGVALAAFAGGWAVAFRSVELGQEVVRVHTANAAWTSSTFPVAPKGDRPALAALDGTHLGLLYTQGTANDGPAHVHVATLATTAPGAFASKALTPDTDSARDPALVSAGDRVIATWRTETPVNLNDDVWMQELVWSASAGTLQAPASLPLSLPRQMAHTTGAQTLPGLAASPDGATLVAVWNDEAGAISPAQPKHDVVMEWIPLPLVRLPAGGLPMSRRSSRSVPQLATSPWMRRASAPVSALTLLSFLSSFVPRTAFAAPEAPATPVAIDEPVQAAAGQLQKPEDVKVLEPASSQTNGGAAVGPGGKNGVSGKDLDVAGPKTAEDVQVSDKLEGANPVPMSKPPTNPDKTGASSQAISVPQGAGKIQGMGESFSAQLSTGVASYSIPIALPTARGGAGPSLALSYSSSGGHGVAGVGWDIGVPFIARQTDRGIPRYDDPPTGGAWHPGQDRFVFNGGQELVPICLVEAGGACAGALPTEVMPDFTNGGGWQYFRPRVEGGFLRFFWSPDHRSWRVQSKTGVTMELGVPSDTPTETQGLEVEPNAESHVFRWLLVRQYDAQRDGDGRPVNLTVYGYAQTEEGGARYLTDVYDTSPAADPSNTSNLGAWAHHARLVYEPRPDTSFSYKRGWKTATTVRLARVDVSARELALPARNLVRRVRLSYHGAYHGSLLTEVKVEGRCDEAPVEDANGALPATACPALPPLTLGYSHVAANGAPGDLPGYEAFDETIRDFGAGSPDHSVDEDQTDLFDVNADGLQDVVITMPGLYGGEHGVFLNKGTTFAFEAMAVKDAAGPSTSVDAGILTLKNPNVSPQDIDGDGIVDLVHMPMVKDYSIHTPTRVNGKLTWLGRPVATASGQSPKIDFTKEGAHVRVMDVNGDGLVDVVHTSATEVQTFLSLGRYPNGAGQFGVAAWTAADAASISNDPIVACVPWSATPVRLGDEDVKLADMNGDGLTDIVRVRKGDIRYWPGRGNGFWGTGDRADCLKPGFAQERHIAMGDSPSFWNPETAELRLDDVNGDGLDDLVSVRFDAIDVWLNVDGVGWTKDRHTFFGTPKAPEGKNRVRLVDVNGSGTRDILWGEAFSYKYIDLQGGKQPALLTRVDNGLGKTTELEYATSAEEMIAAAAANKAWTRTMPTVTHVVKRVTDRDNLALVGRPAGAYVTEYTYSNPVFEGRQREFRGFSETTVRKVGDINSPSSESISTFLLGECVDETPGQCAEPWRDNPREALKGLPVVEQTSASATGVVASTTHHTYTLRQLYIGLDGRAVRHAFELATDTWMYDTDGWVAGGQQVDVTNVVLDTNPDDDTDAGELVATGSAETPVPLVLPSTAGRAHTRSSAVTDAFGNRRTATAYGCVDGCPDGVDETIVSYTSAKRIDEPSGWMWRSDESWTMGAWGEKRHQTLVEHDAFGNPTVTRAWLHGARELFRYHEDLAAAVAPSPDTRSQNDTLITLSANARDVFGHVTLERTAGNRCHFVTYDGTYSDFPASETSRVGAVGADACGTTSLTTTAVFDRGLGVATEVTDPHGQRTSVAYDRFGRVTSITKPRANPAVVGELSGAPSVLVEYLLPDVTKNPFSVVHTRSADGPGEDTASYVHSWSFVDGMGRTIASAAQADPTAGDAGDYIFGGITDYDAKGAPAKVYQPEFRSGDAGALASFTISTHAKRQEYDAFGRGTTAYGFDELPTLTTRYHALSTDAWDQADLLSSEHLGTYASSRKDGHGRDVAMVERVKLPNDTLEARETQRFYLPTGEVYFLRRLQVGTGNVVDRWFGFDSLGRMVLNVDPSTSAFFSADPSTNPDSILAWRYVYNDAGDLVGTSDARGCGQNFHYDAGGRLVAEDYSPCKKAHAPYTVPDLLTGAGTEVFTLYDVVPEAASSCAIDARFVLGRATMVSDRGQQMVTGVDGRGRPVCGAKRIAVPGPTPSAIEDRYASRWYAKHASFDGADRPVLETTGAVTADLLAVDPEHPSDAPSSAVTTKYTKRGAVKSVGGSYGALVTSVTREADGAIGQITYGDLAQTSTVFTHDIRRRVRTVQTFRSPPSAWSTPTSYAPSPAPGGTPTTFQLTLEDGEFEYDEVDNPTRIKDYRNPAEWPVGAKPVSRDISYDDLYRVTKVQYAYSDGDGWISPFAPENAGQTDPRRGKPAPHREFATRPHEQTYAFDWLGNTTTTDDDAHGFYDRSLGTITNSTYRLTSAFGTNGNLTAAYDASGYMTDLSVVRVGDCLPAGSVCSHRYAYAWDEVGRLVQARRWDLETPGAAGSTLPSAPPDVELGYAYDGSDDRVRKTAVDAGDERHTVYVFGSLELRRAVFADGDYERSADTEVAYLFGHGVRLARLALESADVPTLPGASGLHVFLELPDHLGSSSIVLDKATSELVEQSTYLPYGGAESDYRPERWRGFREDYRFTGKEEDVEIGLIYFGKRYLSPALGRWVSADPLTTHAAGADLNAYAYVHGSVLKEVDLAGLCDGTDCTPAVPPQEPPPASVPPPNASTCDGSCAPPSLADAQLTGPGSSLSGAPNAPPIGSPEFTSRIQAQANILSAGAARHQAEALAHRAPKAPPYHIPNTTALAADDLFNIAAQPSRNGLEKAVAGGLGVIMWGASFLNGVVTDALNIPGNLSAGSSNVADRQGGHAVFDLGKATLAGGLILPELSTPSGNIVLYHGTTANAASKIANGGFRAGSGDLVFFAEDFSTARHFSYEAVSARGASSGMVLKVTLPAEFAPFLERGALGSFRGAPAIDILHGSGFEVVLQGRHLDAINQGIKNGAIGIERIRVGSPLVRYGVSA